MTTRISNWRWALLALAFCIAAVLMNPWFRPGNDEPHVAPDKPAVAEPKATDADEAPPQNVTSASSEEAVAAVRAMGGSVHFADESVARAQTVNLTSCDIRDDDLMVVLALSDIRSLDVSDNGRLTGGAIERLSALRGLETLNISGTGVDDASLQSIAKLPQLRELYLFRTAVTDEGVGELAASASLRMINLWDTAITKSSLTSFARMGRLKRLYLGNSPEPFRAQDRPFPLPKSSLTNEDIAWLRSELPGAKIVFWTPDSPEAPEGLMPPAEKRSKTRVAEPARVTSADGKSTGVAPSEKAKPLSGWTRFLGPTGDGRAAPGERIRRGWNESPPEVVWRIPAGEGYATCAVRDGRFYHWDRVGRNDRLLCGDCETGETIWEKTYPTEYLDAAGYGNGPRASPILDGDLVYTYGANGMLRCQRIDDGELVWEVDTIADFGPAAGLFGVGSTPAIYGDRLLVVVGNPFRPKKDETQAVVAFDKTTGRVRYATGADRAGYATPTFATIQGKPCCLAFVRGGLLGFDPETGDQRFHFPWKARVSGCVNAAQPVVSGNRILITEAYGAGSALLEIGKDDQVQVVWRDRLRSREKILQSHWSTPLFIDGFLFGCHGRHAHEAAMRCIDWETGEVQWEFATYSRASYLEVARNILRVDEHGRVELIEPTPEGFRVLESLYLGASKNGDQEPVLTKPIWAPPAYVGGRAYIRGAQELACIDFSSREPGAAEQASQSPRR